MNNEFKKIKNNNYTRYVLEDDASVTTGAIATVPGALGGVRKRDDSILAQEAGKEKDAPKPRNFVAKNAKMGGAGKMQDKSKTIPRKEKHKKPVAEGSMDELEQRRKLIKYISQKKGWDVSDLELAKTSELILMYKKIKEQDVSENNHPDEKEDKELIRKMVKRDALKKEGYGMGGYASAMSSAIQPGNGPDVSEDDTEQEVGMAGSELYGIAKHAKELLALIHQQGQEQGLEAWQQSKITKAADYLTSVLQSMDYDATGDQDVSEGYDPVESDYQQWENILVKDGYRGDPSGTHALELVAGDYRGSEGYISTIRNILAHVKQNRQALGTAVSDRKTVKDCIMDIKREYPQLYQAAQQPQGVAEGSLNEFAPGAGDDGGEDPYKYPKPESYRRSVDFFGKFEAGHFDKEDMNDATGEFKGYWGKTQIAYFKFDNPAKTGSNDPGMGWYYEPDTDGNDGSSVNPAVDTSAQRKQQELSMIDAFLKSGQTPKPGSQIHSMMKRHGVAEGEKKGLYYYVNKRKKAGTSRDASHPKAPSAQAWKDAAKTAKSEGADSYMESLAAKLAEKIPKGADVDYYIKDFAKSTAPQFKNKGPNKRRQMAIAAWNDSKRKK
jgi:hypothetical protein